MSKLNDLRPNMAVLYAEHYHAVYNMCSPELKAKFDKAFNNDTYQDKEVNYLVKKIAENAERAADEMPVKKPIKQLVDKV